MRTPRHPRAPRRRGITFADYYSVYAARQIWTPQSTRAIDLTARTFPHRHTALTAITHADIETWVRTMHDEGLAPATIRTRVSNVRAVLYSAVRDGLIPANPAVGVRLPRATTRATTTAMPTATQVDRLVRSSPPPYDRLFALCAYAGLRLGEARALTWDDVDLDAGRLAVRRQIQLTPGGGSQVVAPKYDSYRTIPIAPELAAVLAPVSRKGPGFVAGTLDDHPLHPGSINRVWTHQRTGCDLADGLRVHDLRHWYASRLIADGCDILTVQRRLGHARASTTLDTYAHALDGAA